MKLIFHFRKHHQNVRIEIVYTSDPEDVKIEIVYTSDPENFKIEIVFTSDPKNFKIEIVYTSEPEISKSKLFTLLTPKISKSKFKKILGQQFKILLRPGTGRLSPQIDFFAPGAQKNQFCGPHRPARPRKSNI